MWPIFVVLTHLFVFCAVCVCFSGGSEDGLCQKTGSTAGQCRCKANVAGSACAECKEGYYGLNNDDPLGCKCENLCVNEVIMHSFS